MSLILLLCVLFFGGIALVLAEFMLPGGVLGVIGGLMLVGVMIATGLYYPGYAVVVIPAQLFLVAGTIVFGFWLIANTRFGQPLMLRSSQREEEGWTNQQSDLSLVGKTGKVLTALRPAGTIELAGERIDVVSDGTFIAEGAPVVVTEVHGNRVVVEAVAETAPSDAPTAQA